MQIKEGFKKIWAYLKKDTWDSWLVSIILVFIFIKFIFFPTIAFAMGTAMPLVVVESCSMYHESGFEEWWSKNAEWYMSEGINKSDFKAFESKNGLNKGDIIFVYGRSDYKTGDIIIFNAPTKYPVIHRMVSETPLETKGDHNTGQLSFEKNIEPTTIIGKKVLKVPLLGWIKLVFFEPLKPSSERGLCK